MNKWWVKTYLTLTLMGVMGIASAQNEIQLSIGSVTVAPADLSSASCIQVPIFINDPVGRDLRDMTFTVELSGDTGIIDGGVAANMTVVNAFQAGAGTGISNPGTDLANINSSATPTCGLIFNQATQGSGPAADFVQGTQIGTALINDNQGGVGRKQGFVIDFIGGGSLATLPSGTDLLVAVLEIPIIANPGAAQLMVSAVSNAVVADANVYTFLDGTLTTEAFDLSSALGTVNIFAVEDCSAATITDNMGSASGSSININYLDPIVGGVGGDMSFAMPHSASVDQIMVTGSDGFNTTVPATGTLTNLTVTTAADGTPGTGSASVNYQVMYAVEFPPASGTFVSGAPCSITATWAPPSCSVVFDAEPAAGQPTNLDATLTNVEYDAGNSRFGMLSGPNAVSVDLVVPSSASGNELSFNDVLSIAAVGDSDVGSYGINLVTGPGGASSSCSVDLTLAPTGPVAVPTLNIWGLIIFLVLLLTVNFTVRHRQRQ